MDVARDLVDVTGFSRKTCHASSNQGYEGQESKASEVSSMAAGSVRSGAWVRTI